MVEELSVAGGVGVNGTLARVGMADDRRWQRIWSVAVGIAVYGMLAREGNGGWQMAESVSIGRGVKVVRAANWQMKG